MTPQRAKTYVWLLVALAASVGANLMFFQPGEAARKRLIAQGESGSRHAAGGTAVQSARISISSARDTSSAIDPQTILAVQRELKQAGYYPGQIDGRASYLTHAAIFAFERESGMPLTGEPSQALLKSIILGPARRNGTGLSRIVRGSAAERLIRDIQIKLVDLGYAAGNDDGRMTSQLIRAIRAFEVDSGLQPTGNISAGLLMHLHRSTAAFQPRRG